MYKEISVKELGDAFPKNGTTQEQIEYVLTYAVRSPSTHNSQPWQFHFEGAALQVLNDDSFVMPLTDPSSRYRSIGQGFFLYHLFLLLRYFRMSPQMAIINDGKSVATVTYTSSQGVDPMLEPLVSALLRRRNRRGVFMKDNPIADTLIADATHYTGPLPVGLDISTTHFSAASETLQSAGDATKDVVLDKYHSRVFRYEMASWIVANDSKRTTGMAGYSLNMGLSLSRMLSNLFRLFNLGPAIAFVSKKSIVSASGIFTFSSKEDRQGWLSVGFHACHTMLTLLSAGYSSSVFVATIEDPKTRKSVGDLFSITDDQPLQFLFVSGKFSDQVEWYTNRTPFRDKVN